MKIAQRLRSNLELLVLMLPLMAILPLVSMSQPGQAGASGAQYAVNGKIAFARNQNGLSNIYVMNADGSGQTELTNTASDYFPTWSPEGTKIAFTSGRGGAWNIYVMNSDGSGQTRLTTGLYGNEECLHLAWSPDSKKIAYDSYPDGIYVINIDGTQTRLTTGVDDNSPTWSPDGTRIAFSSYRGNFWGGAIYIMNADGTGITQLTTNLGYYSLPAWSPDGSKIAFSYSPNASPDAIYVINADGSNLTKLTDYIGDYNPTWSADGTKIAYLDQTGVCIMKADGTGQTRLTYNYPLTDSEIAWGVRSMQATNIAPSRWINNNSTSIQADLIDDGSGINAATLQVAIDGSAISSCSLSALHISCPVSGLSEGQHSITVTFKTNNGIAGIGGASFSVDITPPSIAITTPALNPGSSITATLADSGSGIDQSTVYAYLDGSSQPLSGCSVTASNFICSDAGMTAGSHTVTIIAKDIAGNSTTENYSFQVDPVAPVISQISPTGLVNATTATVSAYYADAESGINTSSVKLVINGMDVTSQSSVFANHIVYLNKNGGPQFVHLEVSDNAGNDQYANWPYQVKEDNYFPWYDNSNGLAWLLMAQPSGTGSASFDSSLGNTPEGSLSVADGTMGYLRIANGFGGPASIATYDTRSLISERSLFGNSFEEIWATPYDQLDSHYYWPAYFGGEAGVKEWVLVSNPPENGEDVKVDLMMSGGTIEAGHVIHPGDTWTPTYPANYGPVEVRAYSAATGNPADARKVIASERIMFNGSFNEMPGIPASKLSNDNLWPWFDSINSFDLLGVGNPNSQTIYLFVFIAGVRQGGIYGQPLNPGRTIGWTMPNIMDGPVEVKGCYDDSETCFQPAKIYSSQIVRFGPSYEETAGTSPADLKPTSNWTWYDEITPGSYNWVLVSNPNLVSVIYYQISIAGHLDPNNPADPYYASSHGHLGPQQKVTPQFPGIMGGPVQVKGCFYPFAADGSCSNPAPVLASQRVVWNGYFNEVVGKGM